MANALLGLQTTLLGLATVFAGLFIIWAVMKLMQSVFRKADAKKGKADAKKREDTTLADAAEPPKTDDAELIAVISAAVAAYLGTYEGIRIKSFKRVQTNSSVWGDIGRQESTARNIRNFRG